MSAKNIVKVFSGSSPFPELRYEAELVSSVISGGRPACPLNLDGEVKVRNERLWRLIQICWHTMPQSRPVMADVQVLLEEIIGGTEMRQCPLREFVILGKLDLKGYVRGVIKGM